MATQAQTVLAECPNFEEVQGFYGGIRHTVAISSEFTVEMRNQPGRRVITRSVYDLEGKRGAGCPNCLYTGQVAEFMRRDCGSYFELRPCPHCEHD